MGSWRRFLPWVGGLHPAWALVVGVAGTLIVLYLFGHWLAPPVPPGGTTTTHPPQTPNSATVTQITNPTDAQRQLLEAQAREAQLWAELQTLRSSMDAMTKAIATLRVTGSGAFVPLPGPVGPPGPQGPAGTPGQTPALTSTPTTYRYTDWRLTFTGDIQKGTADYALTQKFEVDHITGRQKDGTPVSLLRVFEVGPGETKTPIPAVTTTTVIDETHNHWFANPTIQVGYAASWPISTTTGLPNGSFAPGAIVSVQWWRYGRTPAAEDCSLAVLSPSVLVTSNVRAVGLAPVGVNLGRIPHQPFKDIWVSPFVVYDPSTRQVRAGAAFQASF